MKEIGIIIISGLSGSGKSTALRTLEDLGFYCVDNLPVTLLPQFIDLCRSSSHDISRIALGIDVRERFFLKEYKPTLAMLRSHGAHIELIFLECSDKTLIQRFSETRRQHPLSQEGSVVEGINSERAMLEEMKLEADRIIDTSEMNVHQLRNFFQKCFVGISSTDMAITFMSFGFKYGVPHNIDMLFDVRFMPNPHFVGELRELNGNDPRVSEYVLQGADTLIFLEKLKDFLSFQIPLFEREGKAYLTVALGCTGGKHRSVAIVNRLKQLCEPARERIHVIHRDIDH